MSDIPDLARRFDRASYDPAKSLVKLDELQHHEKMLPAAIAEAKKRLGDVHIIVGQIERLEVLQDERRERC